MFICTTDALYTRPLAGLGADDAEQFGATNAMLGGMIRRMDEAGFLAPRGFAVSVAGYRRLVRASGLAAWQDELLGAIDAERSNLGRVGAAVRASLLSAALPADLHQEIVACYRGLVEDAGDWPRPVAVMGSAAPEEMAEAAFGGRQPPCLFVQSAPALLDAVRECYAAAYSDRAIAFRMDRGIAHGAVRLSVAVQTMVWANMGARAAAPKRNAAAAPPPGF